MTTDGSGPDDEVDGDETDLGTLSTPRARAPWERKDPKDDEVKHSALVGFMSVPVARRFPIRRSTFLMALAFIGLATLLYFYPPQSTSTGSGVVLHTSQGDVYVPNATPVSTTSTTLAPAPTTTTTTTAIPSPTSTVFSTTPTTPTSTSTSTTTTAPSGGSATSTTTSPASGGGSGFGTTTTTSLPR